MRVRVCRHGARFQRARSEHCSPRDRALRRRGPRQPTRFSFRWVRQGGSRRRDCSLPSCNSGAAVLSCIRGALLLSCSEPRRRMPAPGDGGRLRRSPADTRSDDDQERSGVLITDREGSVAPHGTLPAMRAITHVEGKAIRSSRRARRGAGCWLRRTIGASGRTPMSSSRMTWRRASAARRPLIGSACPDGRRGGGGFARPHSGRSRDVRQRPPVCARGRGRRHAHGRRARGSSGAGVGSASGDAGLSKEQLRSGPRAFQPLLRFLEAVA